MVAERTRLVFEAKIADLKVKMGGPAADYGQPKSGALVLTLNIEQPLRPKAPSPGSYGVGGYGRAEVEVGPPPKVSAQKKPESDEEYEARTKPERAALERYEDGLRRFTEARAKYQAEEAGYDARVRSYAMLVGIASVFGNTALRVEMTPADQDVLPGFGVSLLEAPAGGDR